MTNQILARLSLLATVTALPAIFHGSLMAAVTPNGPTASTVPFVASNAATPHTSWTGNPVTLKGAMSSPLLGTDSFSWDWDPGDGGTHCTGVIDTAYNISDSSGTDNPYVIQCGHTYTGAAGTVFTAVLTVTDQANSLVSPAVNCPPSVTQGACYYTSLNPPPPNLSVEVNNAIDNGLWYLHRFMRRYPASQDGGTTNVDVGDWSSVGGNVEDPSGGGGGPTGSNCVAFENSGFLQDNSPANIYSDDVRRCLNTLFNDLSTIFVSNGQPVGDPSWSPVSGTYNADQNGNGVGVSIASGSNSNYQNGMVLDAIVASGTKNTVVTPNTLVANQIQSGGIVGTGPSGAYTYKDLVYDMTDYYSYCQDQTESGGWHYACQEAGGDNSASQWAAIGIIPATRNFGAPLDPEVHLENQSWLGNSFSSNSATNGYFGYTGPGPLWGPYADTPSGLVQLAMNGLGRGTSLSTVNGQVQMWDSAETFLRDNFDSQTTGWESPVPGNDPNYTCQDFSGCPGLKTYYYGMLSFTKSMLLHDNSGTGLNTTPLTHLRSLDDPLNCAAPGVPVQAPGSGTGPCYPDLDWYAAQSSSFGGTDATDGVARTLVGSQNTDGSWFGHNADSSQFPLETGFAVTMLNKTVFQPVPVACFTVNPNNVANGSPVQLDGSCSTEQNPSNHLTTWQWDISGGNGTPNYTIGPGSPQCLTPSCSKIIANFSAPDPTNLPYSYPVHLLLTDSGALTSTVTNNVVISNPPNPPIANAGGPYNFCPNTDVNGSPIYSPFLVDGSKSTNPDDGMHHTGDPPSAIISYQWDYSCANQFTSATGAQANATSAFDVAGNFGTTFNICLKVTNNDDLAFADPNAVTSSVASAQVMIHTPTDEACTHCITPRGLAKAGSPNVPANIQVLWNDTNSGAFPIDHYNVYRSTSSTFIPSTQIAGATAKAGGGAGAVPVSNPAGGPLVFVDNKGIAAGTTYYYRVYPATINDTETCQGSVSNTLAISIPKGR